MLLSSPFQSTIRGLSFCHTMVRRRMSSVSPSLHSIVLGTINASPGVYYIPVDSHLRFTLASSLTPYDVRLFCDYHSTDFKRGVYHELIWSSTGEDRFAQILCTRPGPIHYHFEAKNKKGEGYVLVEPRLSNLPSNSSADGIMCLSFLSKSLGKLEDWESRLAIARHCNYNMIHFTPIQQLYKVSNSSYAITNHHVLNPLFGKDKTHEDIKELVDMMAREWNILSITDLVYNHAGNDLSLFEQYPDAAYNMINSPHLKPAFLLDAILMQLTRDIHDGKLESIPAHIEKDVHLPRIRSYLLDELLPSYALHEFYMIDVRKTLDKFRQLIQHEIPSSSMHNYEEEYAFHVDYGSFDRFGARIDLQQAQKIFYCADRTPEQACQALSDRLHYLNDTKRARVEADLVFAINNCLQACEYHFFAPLGPRFTTISPRTPFVGNYFAYPEGRLFDTTPGEVEQAYKENNRSFLERAMAHNGWVMNDNPLRNFAEDIHGPNVYFRRELNQWSDIVKLRFGQREEDSPQLWAYMKEYTRLVATTFHGARLDNCHSTPLHVAQYLMDYARELNPNFYILGELFTGSETIDVTFVNKLGINALVRESLNARDTYDLGRLICYFGGREAIGALIPVSTLIQPRHVQSFVYDQTHDNPCPIERLSLVDVLPRAAFVAMSCSPTGSNRGYDELVPHHIDVVHERRTYEKWTDDKMKDLVHAKSILNSLHARLSSQGYNQMIADQLAPNTLMLTRQNPRTHSTVILIGHTDFVLSPTDQHQSISPLTIQGTVDDILFEMSIAWTHNENKLDSFIPDIDHINGLRDRDVDVYIRQHVSKDECQLARIEQDNENKLTQIELNPSTWVPGAVIAFQVNLLPRARRALYELRKVIFEEKLASFRTLVNSLSLNDLNRVLYRCAVEENNSIYHIPAHGPLVYAGLQGIESLLSIVRDLPVDQISKHPLSLHLKHGNSLMNYISQRLIDYPNTQTLGQWFETFFDHIEQFPRYLVPVYFDLLIHETYHICVEQALELMSTPFIQQGSSFVKALAMTSVQTMGIVSNARLPKYDNDDQTEWPSMAAGLPSFCEGIWRNWGRDTFISLRGLLLLTGRFDEARHLILSYASCLRHGLIPNLLAGPRHNARDAIWFWLYSISHYTHLAPDGLAILSTHVQGKPLHQLIHSAITTHLDGLSFREHNAGFNLDRVMNDEGFNNRIGVDQETGFVFGGNRWNCGTWMDKMGSSDHAGNKGHPGSPRDGSAVELVGLSRATVAWLINMIEQGAYPYNDQKNIFEQWLTKIDQNFERYFWIDEENDQSEFVHRRHIYKDTVNSSLKWTDYQFRPNFLIAAVVAPEMFNADHIWTALSQVESLLLGPLGIKTLDPDDAQYVGEYDNDNHSSDFKRAHGYNYHNGPEWLWITGYYLRAKLLWTPSEQRSQTLEHVKEILARHREALFSSEWRALPELTSANGQFCSHSCPAQAWSSATLLEAMYDLQQYE